MSFLGECSSLTGDGIHCWHHSHVGPMTQHGPVQNYSCCHCGNEKVEMPTAGSGFVPVKKHGKFEPKRKFWRWG